MDDGTQLVASSIATLVKDFRAVAHNLANVNTSGYKRLRSAFSQTLQSQMGGGVQRTPIDFTQGALVQTGRPLDLALKGKGFFVIETPEGQLYTRNGTFCANPTGQLVDLSGRTVAGEGGPIVLPGTTSALKVNIAADGAVSVQGQAIGKLKLVEFEDTSALQPVGGNCYRPAESAEPKVAAETTVHQGYREASNVSPIRELVRLITITRVYEGSFKSLAAQDERAKTLLQIAMGS